MQDGAGGRGASYNQITRRRFAGGITSLEQIMALDTAAALQAINDHDVSDSALGFINLFMDKHPELAKAGVANALETAYTAGALAVIMQANFAARGLRDVPLAELHSAEAKAVAAEVLQRCGQHDRKRFTEATAIQRLYASWLVYGFTDDGVQT